MFAQLRSPLRDGEAAQIWTDVSIRCRTEGVLCWMDAAEAPVTQQQCVFFINTSWDVWHSPSTAAPEQECDWNLSSLTLFSLRSLFQFDVESSMQIYSSSHTAYVDYSSPADRFRLQSLMLWSPVDCHFMRCSNLKTEPGGGWVDY